MKQTSILTEIVFNKRTPGTSIGKQSCQFNSTSSRGIAHQELAYGFCTLGSAGVEYSFRKKIFLRGGYRSGRPAKGIFACTALGGGMKWHGIGLDATWRLASSDSPQRNAWHLALTFAI
jgi:hypothetical protein